MGTLGKPSGFGKRTDIEIRMCCGSWHEVPAVFDVRTIKGMR
jgi:hypothetical protein